VTLGGNEMESGVMEGGAPLGKYKKWNMAWKGVLVMVNSFQSLEYL
jgi:hypothetical protein